MLESHAAKAQQSLPREKGAGYGPDHSALFALIQPAAKRLRDYGKDAVPFLKDQASQSPLIAFAALDAIEPGKPVAQVVVSFLEEAKDRNTAEFVSLCASLCSQETHLAVANSVAERLVDNPLRWPQKLNKDYIYWEPPLGFLVACGDARTAKLLTKASSNADPSTVRGKIIAAAAERMRAKLLLPTDRQEQLSRDELLFFQALTDMPRLRNFEHTYWVAAQRIVSRKEVVSWDFLRDVLQNDSNTLSGAGTYEDRNFLALDLIVLQKETEAIPLLKELANGKSPFATMAKKSLIALEAEVGGDRFPIITAFFHRCFRVSACPANGTLSVLKTPLEHRHSTPLIVYPTLPSWLASRLGR